MAEVFMSVTAEYQKAFAADLLTPAYVVIARISNHESVGTFAIQLLSSEIIYPIVVVRCPGLSSSAFIEATSRAVYIECWRLKFALHFLPGGYL